MADRGSPAAVPTLVDQHTISSFLLRAFGRRRGGHVELEVFDKTTGSIQAVPAKDFLIETDGHDEQIELEIGRLEGPAADAVRRLRKRMRQLPAGLYAVVDASSQPVSQGAGLIDAGIHEGVRLLVSQHLVPSLPDRPREALLRFVGLMYQRAPGLEAAIMEFGRAYDQSVQAHLDQLAPGARSGLATELRRRRSRMVDLARDIGAQLEIARWWIVKAPPTTSFVLGDSPVASTSSLGHDDDWLAILDPSSFVVAMSLAPDAALLLAPQALLPVSLPSPDIASVAAAINRLVWRRADRYVIGTDRQSLEQVGGGLDPDSRLASGRPAIELGRIRRAAWRDTLRVVIEARYAVVQGRWQRWERCRLTWGFVPWTGDGTLEEAASDVQVRVLALPRHKRHVRWGGTRPPKAVSAGATAQRR